MPQHRSRRVGGTLDPLLADLRSAHPAVAEFLDELNAPARTYPALALSPPIAFLLACAGSAMEVGGWHLVLFPARHADHRVEVLRLAVRAAASRKETLVAITRSRTAVDYALAQEPKRKADVLPFHARGPDDVPRAE